MRFGFAVLSAIIFLSISIVGLALSGVNVVPFFAVSGLGVAVCCYGLAFRQDVKYALCMIGSTFQLVGFVIGVLLAYGHAVPLWACMSLAAYATVCVLLLAKSIEGYVMRKAITRSVRYV